MELQSFNQFPSFSQTIHQNCDVRELNLEEIEKFSDYFRNPINLLSYLANPVFEALEDTIVDPMTNHICKHFDVMKEKNKIPPNPAMTNTNDGANTATEVIFGLVAAIPAIFHQQFNRMIDSKTYLAIV